MVRLRPILSANLVAWFLRALSNTIGCFPPVWSSWSSLTVNLDSKFLWFDVPAVWLVIGVWIVWQNGLLTGWNFPLLDVMKHIYWGLLLELTDLWPTLEGVDLMVWSAKSAPSIPVKNAWVPKFWDPYIFDFSWDFYSLRIILFFLIISLAWNYCSFLCRIISYLILISAINFFFWPDISLVLPLTFINCSIR